MFFVYQYLTIEAQVSGKPKRLDHSQGSLLKKKKCSDYDFE